MTVAVVRYILYLSGFLSVMASYQPDVKPVRCPGLFCGRINITSDCGACPWGSRPDSDTMCLPCKADPSFYDWLYLGFMAMVTPALHWFFIDFTNKKKNSFLLVLHISALVESVVAAVCTLLVSAPYGSLRLESCRVQSLADWYTMVYNPSPDYTSTIHCTQEVVYPLYTIVMKYYAFGLLCMMLARPLLSAMFVSYRGTKSIYAGLFFFPILVLIQAVFAGLIYYSFPFIVLGVSVVTNAAHFAFFPDQNMKHLLVANIKNPRNLIILLCHWLLHAYGIIAVTQLQNPGFHAPLLFLVPVPALFYLITVNFTSPSALESA